MKDEIKEIYLSNLEWTKTHDNIGGVMGNIVFKDNISYETYQKLLKSGYFVLCDKDYITNLQEKYNGIKSNFDIQLEYDKELENKITNLQEENKRLKEKNKLTPDELVSMLNQELVRHNKNYKSRNEKANTLLDELLERAYIDGEYIMYDFSTSELLEVKQALEEDDKVE